MVVTKTPLRVSLFGGGSDLPNYYKHNDGLCVSSSIDEYITIALNTCHTPHVKLMYSEIEIVNAPEELKHNRVRESLLLHEIDNGIEIASFANIPTKGSGLGSSSSFTVGLINAIRTEYDMPGRSPFDLAEDACHIEIERCGEPIGKQDQYAAAYGGFHAYEFSSHGVAMRPIHISKANKLLLNDDLLFFSTGITRNASNILKKQVSNNKVDVTSQMVEIARSGVVALERGHLNYVGDLLHQSWLLKKQQADGISNEWIDEMYDAGMKAGALGGKLLGAGGGGYMMFYVPSNRHYQIRKAMSKLQCHEWFFHFTDTGSTVHKIS